MNLRELNKFLNGGVNSFIDALYILALPKLWFRLKSTQIYYNQENPETSKGSAIELTQSLFQNNTPTVVELKHYLEKNIPDHYTSVLVHGSVASNEIIGYSDLDLIIIIKDSVLKNPKLLSKTGYHLYRSRRFLHKFDPLQHHGLFIIPESFLRDFDTGFIPVSLLAEAKVLSGEKSFTINVSTYPYRGRLEVVTQHLRKIIQQHRIPNNKYGLKAVLSEFMLLPALYIQERYKTDISKKDSFLEASKDFSETDYAIMNEISAIRLNWKKDIPLLRSKLLCLLRALPGGKIGFLSGKANKDIVNGLKGVQGQKMIRLMDVMLEKAHKADKK